MNNISFTSIKNISAVPCTVRSSTTADPKDYIKANAINVELDNYDSNDLFEYNKALESSTIPNVKHPVNPNFLNITTIKRYPDKDSKNFHILINNKELMVEDKNLAMLSFITKLLKKVSNFEESDFFIEKDYIIGDEAPRATCIGKDLRDYEDDDYLLTLASIHCADQVTDISKEAYDDISKRMIDYFS